jgi:hypothetical protein
MRSLWELDTSTACQIICRLGWTQLPDADGRRAKCSTAALHKNKDVYTRPFRQEQYQYVQKVVITGSPICFLIIKMSHLPPPQNCCSASLFAAIYNKPTGGGHPCCVSPPERPAHLTPAFCMFVFCLLFFLNLL